MPVFSHFEKGTGNKKYKAIFKDGSSVQFGDKRYEHFHDQIGLYSNLDHNDMDRRNAYRKRHEAIKLKDGRLAYKVKYSPSWFSYHYLW